MRKQKTIIEVGASDGKHTEVLLDGLVLFNYANHWVPTKIYNLNDQVKFQNNYYELLQDSSLEEQPDSYDCWKQITEIPYANSKVYSFEPNRKTYNLVKQKFQGRRRLKIFNTAIDIEEKDAVFNIDSSQSSLYEYTDNINEIWGDNRKFKFVKKTLIKTLRLDSFIEEHKIKDVDFLWIDAQGNDFNVLKSLGKYIDIVKEGICEVSLDISLYKANNSMEDVKHWLIDKNFECQVRVVHENREADIIFKRKL